MAGDWIRLHRKLLDSAVFSDEWLLRLWVWCLLRAGYCDRQVGGFTVPAGSFLTGRFSAADELNVSPSRWYRGIHQLASLGMITLSATQERTIVTVCHWTSYQSDTVVHGQQVDSKWTTSEQQVNNERTTSGQQTDTRKEGKEGKEEEGECTPAPVPITGIPTQIPPLIEWVRAYASLTSPPIDPEHFFAHHEARGWFLRQGVRMRNWQKSMVTWSKNEKKFGGNGKPRQREFPSAQTVPDMPDASKGERYIP